MGLQKSGTRLGAQRGCVSVTSSSALSTAPSQTRAPGLSRRRRRGASASQRGPEIQGRVTASQCSRAGSVTGGGPHNQLSVTEKTQARDMWLCSDSPRLRQSQSANHRLTEETPSGARRRRPGVPLTAQRVRAGGRGAGPPRPAWSAGLSRARVRVERGSEPSCAAGQ